MKFKTVIIACVSCAVLFGIGGYTFGRFSAPGKILTINEPGRIEYRDRPGFITTTNTGPCCDQYNRTLQYLDTFLSAPPMIDEISANLIRFRILSNRYALQYRIADVPVFHIAPHAGVSVIFIDGRVYLLPTAFLSLDYANIGGTIVGGSIGIITIVSLSAYYRF